MLVQLKLILIVSGFVTIICGSIVMIFYLIVSKIKKRQLSRKVMFLIYPVTFILCIILPLFLAIYSTLGSSKNPAFLLIPLLIIAVITLFIAKSVPRR